MIENLCKKNNIDFKSIYEIVIAGNTVMNHFLLGIPVKSLSVAPYNAVFNELEPFYAKDIGLNINPHGKVFISPNIKSFVGGDISAGLIAADLRNVKGNILFIDLGTNGEIVLKMDDKFIATSTAAGPAFEGINISSGMMAIPGAIYKAEYKDKKLILYTLKNKKPLGICGTGLIDLISIFVENGDISIGGKIANPSQKIEVQNGIYITQKDVREVQLAIAAIKAGIKSLLKFYKLSLNNIDKIMIAGAFGNYLNIGNAQNIGLLPYFPKEKITFLGNSSLGGARALLLNSDLKNEIFDLVENIEHFSLGADSNFQEYFVDALSFDGKSFFD